MKNAVRAGLAWGLTGLVCVSVFACAPADGERRSALATSGMKLTSSAFGEGASIPVLYTCDGEDVSPPLRWEGVPEGTRSLALACEDPDAPAHVWVHWVLYQLPASQRELPERFKGGLEGLTDFKRTGYGGPCPPSGSHRYIFTLYALDAEPGLPAGATLAQLRAAMAGHILASAQLMGRYARTR